jgi:hypothetical protein
LQSRLPTLLSLINHSANLGASADCLSCGGGGVNSHARHNSFTWASADEEGGRGGIFPRALSLTHRAASALEADDVIYRSALQSYKLYRTLTSSERSKRGAVYRNERRRRWRRRCTSTLVTTLSQGVDAAAARGERGPRGGIHTHRVRRRCRSCAVMCRSILAE